MSVAVSRPVVRYHGGKWMLAPWIISHFPSHRVYVEPYGGGGSVLMRKPRSYAEVYNDLDGEMCNLFRVLRDDGDELWRRIELTAFAREEYNDAFPVCEDPMEMARRTMVRSFMGFGSNSIQRRVKSGFRANSNRAGTTPAHDWRNLPEAMQATVERLRGVVIENRDAMDVVLQHDSPETLHYCDPPYPHSTRSQNMHGMHGYAHEMTDAQHEAMAAVLGGVEGAVIVSGYACPLYDEDLFSGWHRVQRKALADGARARTEVLWMNPKAEHGAHSLWSDPQPEAK